LPAFDIKWFLHPHVSDLAPDWTARGLPILTLELEAATMSRGLNMSTLCVLSLTELPPIIPSPRQEETMARHIARWLTGVSFLILALSASAQSGAVKVTPLGGVEGEFCPQDRALIFEDPNGTRILYDPGRTVAGATDPRLGKIDILLVSHMHGDHVGNAYPKAYNSGTCENPDVSVSALPNTSAVSIALAKGSKIVVGSEMPPFFAAKLKAGGGDPRNAVLTRFGGSTTIGGVRIATVPALHSNGVDPDYIGGDLGAAMKAAGIAGDVGLATGYVLKFSNGLVAYLSGDTGITAEQDVVIRGHYAAKLAVMNIGDGFTTGPVEAAYVINDLVKPASVIASHANEVATKDGKVIAGSKTDRFTKAVKVPVYAPLSGKTMEFDAAGKCVGGC
jgi:L-ascorbate metabolism protein UlaG (beta-lactamase superfamily)